MLRTRRSAVAVCLLAAAPLMAQDPGCEDFTTDLIAGQTIDVGDVTIRNTATHLIIHIDTDESWDLSEVHIYAGFGPPPLNGGGNPPPGQFPYSTSYPDPQDQHTEIIPLADLGADCDDTLDIAIHAVVHETDEGDDGRSETAWGFGDKTWPGNRWGWYFCYTVCCEDCPNALLPLTVEPLQHGTTADFCLYEADPGDKVAFFGSCGAIDCDNGTRLGTQFADLRLDLTRARFLGLAFADGTGKATLSLYIPPSAPTRAGAYFQAATANGALSEKSMIVVAPIFP